jgi:hypothetical protein
VRRQRRQPDDVVAPAYVQGCCAVDARAHVTPPLPSNYMNNSSSVVPTHAMFTAGASLWQVAAAAQAEATKRVEAAKRARNQAYLQRARALATAGGAMGMAAAAGALLVPPAEMVRNGGKW